MGIELEEGYVVGWDGEMWLKVGMGKWVEELKG